MTRKNEVLSNKQRLEDIENNFDSMGSVDKEWLISRVKTLTAALERIVDMGLQHFNVQTAADALSEGES